MSKTKDSKKSSKRKVVLIVALILVFAFIADGIICNKLLWVSKYSYDASTGSSVRIVQLSDLHNATFGKNNSRLKNKVRELSPDIIVITGDYIDSNHTDTEVAINLSEELTDIAPVYFISGNHEAWMIGYDEFETALAGEGVTVMKNQSIRLKINDVDINLTGIEDPYFLLNEGSSISRELEKNPADSSADVNILLSHRPEYFETYAGSGYDIIFTGHAHGGQIRIPFVGGIVAPDQGLFPEYDAGVYEDADMDMIVSRGLGNSVLPLRINNMAEIVVMDIK